MARKRTSARPGKTSAKRAPAQSANPRSTIAGGFSQLINRAIRSGRLTDAGPAAQRLYSYLTYFAEPAEGFRFQVGVATLARLTGMARPTVRGGIDALGKHGLLATNQPATEGPDGQGIPAIYRLLVPDDTEPCDPAVVYRVVSGAPAPGSADDQPGGAPSTGTPVRRAPSRRRATDHKQEQPKSNNNKPTSNRSEKLAESVVLLQGVGVEDAAALEFARLDPMHIRAVILTAHDKPNVRDAAAYVVKFLRMGWKPSPKMVAKAKAEREAPARTAEAERIRKGRLAQIDAEQDRVATERADVERQLAGLTVDELELLFEQLLEDAGDLAKIYRRTGVKHPATRAAMARKLAGN